MASLLAIAFLALVVLPRPVGAADSRLRLLGQYTYPTRDTFQDTTVGGFSGLAYDSARNLYYVIADDRGEYQPARFYTLQIDVRPDGIGSVTIIAVTTLDSDAARPGIQPYEKNSLDPEEIALLPGGELLLTSERDLNGRPWIRRFALDGTLLGELPIPEHFMTEMQTGPDGKPTIVKGVRNNLGFEGLALAPDGRAFYTTNEEALAQDGPLASPADGTVIRILRYDLMASGWQAGPEVAYRTEKIFSAPNPPTEFADNGVSALLWVNQLWPDLDLLAMERSFATGVGNNVVIFGVKLAGAESTAELEALPNPYYGKLATKTPLVRMKDIAVEADNLEGMTLGPRLPNGKPSLIVISDDNFSTSQPPQINQFLLFELNDTAAVPASSAAPAAPAAALPSSQPSGPVQLPAALPRTGSHAVAVPLLALSLLLLGAGLLLRHANNSRRR
jgi:LPXTG-motif cell wall-anchored protein